MTSHAPRQPVLRLVGVRKRFGKVTALDDVSLDIDPGEIHAVLGENGAGKSTLMNAIFGIVELDAGEIVLRGEVVRFGSPRDAHRAGIGMVHQDFALFDALSVAENLALALTPPGAARWSPTEVRHRAERLAEEVGLEVGDVRTPIGGLPVGTRQRIEIVKALAGRTDVLILDEPTAVLTPAETRQLLAMLRRLRGRGAAILFISHKLAEVMEVADRVTVMRRGRVVATAPTHGVSAERLAEWMVGPFAPRRRTPTSDEGRPVLLTVERLSVDGRGRTCGLHDAGLAVRAGEILGVAGVDGNGQDELFAALTGLRRADRGTIRIEGNAVRRPAPDTMIAAGVANVPPDRRRQGSIGEMSVRDNAVLHVGLLEGLSRGPFLPRAASRRLAGALVERYAIQVAGLEAPASSLSGGNLQRLIVARALHAKPKVLVAFNPTRGLDLAATEAVYDALFEARENGMAVVLLSTDLDEVLALADRIAVLHSGRLSEPLRAPVSSERIGLLMAGQASTGDALGEDRPA